MATIDLAKLSVREANELIRKAGAAGEDVDVLNPDAKHHIGVGLVHDVNVHVRGSAGYFCAGLTDTARFEVDNNVGWGLADNMLGGTAIVHGNAGAIAGVANRGADIIVHGNVGSRAGQVMKAGNLICVGNASFMAGYIMYGGRIIILGESGEQVGQDMTGGDIIVGGRINSMGKDAALTDLDQADKDEILELLERYKISFNGTLQRIANDGKQLRYSRNEPRVRNIPFFEATGEAGYWNEKVLEVPGFCLRANVAMHDAEF